MVERSGNNVKVFGPLPAWEEQLVVGGLLGDSGGELGTRGARILITHRWEDYPYLSWKHDIVDCSEVLTAGKITPTRKGPRFYIGTHRCLLPYCNAFYSQGSSHKVLVPEILDALLPLGLAVWYMDDGSLSIGRGRITLTLSTQCFSEKENKVIQGYFLSRHSLYFHIQKQWRKDYSKNYYFLTLTNFPEVEQFIDIVKPYAVPCMERKFPREAIIM